MATLTISIIVVFVLGYALIATESLTKVNKAAIALLMLVSIFAKRMQRYKKKSNNRPFLYYNYMKSFTYLQF